MITKDMAKPDSKWMKQRQEWERLYELYNKEHFLDLITTAFITQKVDLELAYNGGINNAV